MSQILNDLNTQLAKTNQLITAKNTAIAVTTKSVSDWKVEALRLKLRYESLGGLASKAKKSEYYGDWQAAVNKVAYYEARLTNQKGELTLLKNQLAAIQQNIDDFHAAVETSVSQGIPEAGSVEIADAIVSSQVALTEQQLEQQQAIADAELKSTTDTADAATKNRKLFITIAAVFVIIVGAILIRKMLKKKKKK